MCVCVLVQVGMIIFPLFGRLFTSAGVNSSFLHLSQAFLFFSPPPQNSLPRRRKQVWSYSTSANLACFGFHSGFPWHKSKRTEHRGLAREYHHLLTAGYGNPQPLETDCLLCGSMSELGALRPGSHHKDHASSCLRASLTVQHETSSVRGSCLFNCICQP